MQLASSKGFVIRVVPGDNVQLSTQSPVLSNRGWHKLPPAVFNAAGKSGISISGALGIL